jgi:hypothetical protein
MKTKTRKSSPAKLITNGPNEQWTHDDIAFAAYCLWENEGRPQGRDWEHWFRAEDLLKQSTHRAHVPA